MRKRQLTWLDEKCYSQLPDELREQKLEFQRLTTKIKRREKSLKRRYEEYKKDKETLREWKKEQTERFNQLIDLHKDYVPTISITYSGRSKRWGSRNNSWSITMKYGGRTFNIYIGTDKNVRIQLNKIGVEVPLSLTRTQGSQKRLSSKIKEFIQPNILNRLRDLNENYEGFTTWCELYENKKLKGIDFLVKIPE